MGGQYDLIPYLLLLGSILMLMQHRHSNTYLCCLTLALSIALKPTTVLLLLPVAPLFLVSRPNNSKSSLIPPLVFMASLLICCIIELYFFLLDPSYSNTVGTGGVILFKNSRLFEFNLFVSFYAFLVIYFAVISLRLSRRPVLGVEKSQLLACLTLSSVGCLFTLHSVSSLGWSCISAIVLPFIFSHNQASLIFPNLAYQIAFIAHLAVIPNSPFMDMFSPLVSILPAYVIQHIPDMAIGFVYSTLEKPTSDQIVCLTTILFFCSSCFLFYSNVKTISRLYGS